MTPEIAMIIAAGIGGIIAITTMFIAHRFSSRDNARQRKHAADERFFYEIYEKRLALYEEVIKTLAAMNKPEEEFLKMSMPELSSKALVDFHTLLVLTNRLRIYGNPSTSSILDESSARLKEICKESGEPSLPIEVLAAGKNMTSVQVLSKSFVSIISGALREFTSCVRKEVKMDFIDDRLDRFNKTITGEKQEKE